MVEISDQSTSTEVSYSNASDIPLGAKVGYAVIALIGFCGLAVCLGEYLLDSSFSHAGRVVYDIERKIRPMLTLLLQHKADDL